MYFNDAHTWQSIATFSSNTIVIVHTYLEVLQLYTRSSWPRVQRDIIHRPAEPRQAAVGPELRHVRRGDTHRINRQKRCDLAFERLPDVKCQALEADGLHGAHAEAKDLKEVDVLAA